MRASRVCPGGHRCYRPVWQCRPQPACHTLLWPNFMRDVPRQSRKGPLAPGLTVRVAGETCVVERFVVLPGFSLTTCPLSPAEKPPRPFQMPPNFCCRLARLLTCLHHSALMQLMLAARASEHDRITQAVRLEERLVKLLSDSRRSATCHLRDAATHHQVPATMATTPAASSRCQ